MLRPWRIGSTLWDAHDQRTLAPMNDALPLHFNQSAREA